jgi:hypothetical protein
MPPPQSVSPSRRRALPAQRERGDSSAQVPFAHKLVLNQWLLSLFNVKRFENLADLLQGELLEGLDENNIHHFHHALTAQLFNLTELPTALLLEYDQNIVKHTLRLNERRVGRREEPIVWKYFQYLALLFTEIYLDRYFRDPNVLLTALNAQVAKYNADKREADQIASFDESSGAWPQLNKVAYWSATGSGKTFMMHVNVLQYLYYLEKHGRRRELNRMLLLTPNEGLSQQHLREFKTAGIDAELFTKDARGLFAGQAIEILDIHKLKEEMGDKTVAIEAFEGNNLVLVDEGHRGATGGEEGAWMDARKRLCESGFSFEYSATFGQAVKTSKALTDLYSKSILFDYSYRYFYGDGFGKDYQILNLDHKTQRNNLELYLVAALLSSYQQHRLYREERSSFRAFNLEKPLWIFVGGRVTKGLVEQDASDIVQILEFFARYVADRKASIARISQVLSEGLITAEGRNLFSGRFAYLIGCGLTPAQIFDETLGTLFHAPAGGRLYVENLKGVTGEIAVRLGAENEAFGVINVGDDAKLVALCESRGIATGDREFSESLFHSINQPDSSVNLLIGSKKFTEGWSSWRVSTMGLMNVGKGEGAQIIQLFGRGVRLRGYGQSLKRSTRAQLPEAIERPKHIGVLETLGIFGINADYMAQFREFLEEEGLPKNDERAEFILPVINNLGTQKLKLIRLKKTINGISTDFGDAFRRLGPIPTVSKPDPATDPTTAYLQKNRVNLNWYPKIQAMRSGGLGDERVATPTEGQLTARHVSFLDRDRIMRELEEFKAERGWHNLNLTRERIDDLLGDYSWYHLLIPPEELLFDSFEKVAVWEEIAISLLKAYIARYYAFRKSDWEGPHLEYRPLDADDRNLRWVKDSAEASSYRILVDRSREDIVAKLEGLKIAIGKGELEELNFEGLRTVWFGQHLYNPLLSLDGSVVEISPVPLNNGERLFVEDLKVFYDANEEFFKDKQLYLLRNMSRGRGVGFFEAGNFHPDFILWLVVGERQAVIFVDPKGILTLGADDAKIHFYRTIKEIEDRLGDPTVQLHSFIVSNTPYAIIRPRWNMTKSDMEKRHVLFQLEDKDSYVRIMLETADSNPAAAEAP